MNTDKNLLKLHYKAACNNYAYELMRQWELPADDCWWAADEIGGIWCFLQGELALNMQEIIYCIDNDVSLGDYMRYMDYCADCKRVGLPTCNLMHFAENKGIYPQETLDKLKTMHEEVEALTQEVIKGRQSY